MEDWALIRRLAREGVPKAAIARKLGISRTTVDKAIASQGPPKYERASGPTSFTPFEERVRAMLAETPDMPATVLAERVGWTGSIRWFRDNVNRVRVDHRPIDPADRLTWSAGDVAQCDLWFPPRKILLEDGSRALLPVLVMTLAFSKVIAAQMIPSRTAGDILAGMWSIIHSLGAVTKTLWWDRESAIGGRGRPSPPAAAFAGTLGTRIVLAPPRDPETKGMVERTNGYLETSFLPGRAFTSPQDFNAQLGAWLPRANQRMVRSLAPATGSGAGGRPADVLGRDLAAMTVLPPVAPTTGARSRIRLGREYYVRVETCDYSVDPRVIGRFVDIIVSLEQVRVTCEGRVVALHERCWAKRQVITDPEHVAAAAVLRTAYQRATTRERGPRAHTDGHLVQMRALPDYDDLFGIDFHAPDHSTRTS